MAGGADADQRLAGGDVGPQRVELLLGRHAAADADQHQVAFWIASAMPGKLFLSCGSLWTIVTSKPSGCQLGFDKRRQRNLGLVLVIADRAS